MTASAGVLSNDTDVDGDSLVVVAASTPGTALNPSNVSQPILGTYGHLTLNADGSYAYAADTAAANGLKAGEVRTDTFTYLVSDNRGGSSSATLNISITGSNDGPIANNDVLTLSKDSSFSANVIGDHWYQPAWTMVGAGTFDFEATRRKESTVIPAGVDWIKDKATVFLPEENKIRTEKSGEISYDYLIVSAGIKMDIDALPGLREALQTDFVCSNYLDPRKTYRLLKNCKGGNAIFTQPTTPIRCGGAPQKIMYMAEEYLRKHGLREKTNVLFATPGSVIFGVKEFADTLNSIIRSRKIIFKPFYAPVRIDPVKREIIFKYVNPNAGDRSEQPQRQSR